jgi:hypothetical protein
MTSKAEKQRKHKDDEISKNIEDTEDTEDVEDADHADHAEDTENADHEEDAQDEDEDNEEYDDDEDDENRIPIDLTQNETYRGLCTLLEDADGNNILEYISLLHTELIGINKSLENLRLIRKDISRLTDCVEIFVKGKKEKGDVTDVSVLEKKKKTSSKKD